MRSIEARFEDAQKRRQMSSTLMNFGAAIKDGGFTHEAIRRQFNKLVEKEDYIGVPKMDILRHLDSLANPVRTTGKQTQMTFTAPLKALGVR